MQLRRILPFFTCCFIAISTLFTNAYVLQNDGPGQQILIGGEPEYGTTETITIHVTGTQTRYEFEFHSKTMTGQARPTLAAEEGPLPAVMVGMRRLEGWQYAQPAHMQRAKESQRRQECDLTACAICKIQAGEHECHRCDLQPYCQC